MAVSIGVFAAIMVAALLLIMLAGFFCYMFRNYCNQKRKPSHLNNSDSPKKFNLLAHIGSVERTTSDEEANATGGAGRHRPGVSASWKTHTFEQILKQEERSRLTDGKSIGLQQVRFAVPPVESSGQTQQQQQQVAPTTSADQPSPSVSSKSPAPPSRQDGASSAASAARPATPRAG